MNETTRPLGHKNFGTFSPSRPINKPGSKKKKEDGLVINEIDNLTPNKKEN